MDTREFALQMKQDAYEMIESAADDIAVLVENYKYWSDRVRQFDIQLTLW